MSAGLQCWDASGNLVVDFTTRLARVLNYAVVKANGSVNVPGFAQGTPFYAFQPLNIFGPNNFDVSRPIFSVSGTVLSWNYSPPATNRNVLITGTVFFGVF